MYYNTFNIIFNITVITLPELFIGFNVYWTVHHCEN